MPRAWAITSATHDDAAWPGGAGRRLTKRNGLRSLSQAWAYCAGVGSLTTLWLSLTMAVTFGIYGLLRKTVRPGRWLPHGRVALLLLPAWRRWLVAPDPGEAPSVGRAGNGGHRLGRSDDGGPLICLRNRARRMPYSVVGFLQFISPTIVSCSACSGSARTCASPTGVLHRHLGGGSPIRVGLAARIRKAAARRRGGQPGSRRLARTRHLPGQRFARMEWHDRRATGVDQLGHFNRPRFERHCALVQRQTVKAWPVLARKGFELTSVFRINTRYSF